MGRLFDSKQFRDDLSLSGSFSGSFYGDGSGLTNIPTTTTSSYAVSASYAITSDTASYVLNAISSSYSLFAVSASYAVSSSHEIIKEVSSSYADTASFAKSGDGIFSGSFSGSYVGDGSGLTGLSTDTNIKAVYYVTPSGSDSTGKVGDLHNPFKTIGAARDTILDGGNISPTLIHVFPGVYVEDEIQYEKGNFYFEPGALVTTPRRINGNSWGSLDGGITAVDVGNKIFTLGNYDLTTIYDFVSGSRFDVFGSTSNNGQYTIISSSGDTFATQIFVSESIPSSTANGFIRDTTSIFNIGKLPLHSRLDSFATSINVFGHGDFLVSQSIDPSAPDWNGSVLSVSSSNANVEFNFENARAQQGVTIAILTGTVNLTGKKIECTTLGSAATNDGTGYAILLRGTGIFATINVEEIISYKSFSLYIGSPFGGTAYIKTQRIINNDGVSTDSPVVILGQQPDSKIYINSQVIESNDNAFNIQNNIGGEVHIKTDIQAGTGNNIICLNNGKSGYPYDFTYEGNSVGNGYGIVSPYVSNGDDFTLNYIGNVFSKNSAAINWWGGTLNLTGDIIASGSNKRGVEVYGGKINFNNTRIISTGDSIYSTTPQTVYAQTPLYIDTPVNSNITVLGQYNYSGSSQYFSGPVVSPIFSGSFVGVGSGLTGIVSSSYAETASYVETAQTASYVLNSVSSSYSAFAISASYAVSSSHEIIKEISSSYADTASFAESGTGIFSGSFSGSYVGDASGLTNVPTTATASYAVTASYIETAQTASYVLNAISSSYSVYAETASYVEIAQTASYVLNSISSSYSLFAVTASYAISASHEIIKEISSSYADTASYAQSGNGIFSGSFSGSYVGDGSGLLGITSGIFHQTGSYYATTNNLQITGSLLVTGSISGVQGVINSLTASYSITSSHAVSASYAITSETASYVETAQTASYVLNAISSSYAAFAISASYAVSSSHEIIKEVSSSYADTASFAESGNGIFSGSFSGSYVGDGSGLINVLTTTTASYALTASYVETAQTASYIISSSIDGISNYVRNDQTSSMTVLSSSFATTASYVLNSVSSSYSAFATTASYVETSQTASYVLNAISSSFASFAVSASYAVSSSHEIIKEVSSSYADTASFAQSGNGIFSGSFSGSYVGDGSGLTGVDPFPFSGSAVITGSLLVSGSSLPLEVIGSGSTIFSVQGSLGELFAIDDVLSGSLLTINDSGGDSQFEVFSDGRTLIGAEPRSLYTTAITTISLASTSQSLYTLSTSSYDGVFFDYTVTSASNARAGNIMSIWNGGNLVYTENTTTDIGSTIGVTFNVEISQSQAQLISVTDTAGWKIKTTIRSI